MSRRSPVPKYRHDGSGRAFVEHRSIPTKSHRMYLGRFGTPESLKRYQSFLARLTHNLTSAVEIPANCDGMPIDGLILIYLRWARENYTRPQGISSEFDCMYHALRPLSELFGDVTAIEFGPRSMTMIRSHLVKKGRVRTSVNRTIGRIKKFWRWCCEQELVPADLYHKLICVRSLYTGQENVQESQPKGVADMDSVRALLPFLSPTVGTMVRVQYFCGMRPGETCIMRPCDIDISGETWLYKPQRHKNQWRGFSQVKAIPKVAQQIIAPLLIGEPESYIFSPLDAMLWAIEQKIRNRKPRRTLKTVAEERRVEREKNLALRRKRKRWPGERYTSESYRKALEYGFKKAARNNVQIKRFTPNQLRHAILTDVSRMLGQQAAQRWAGHEDLDTTNIYTSLHAAELIEVARKLDVEWENPPC